MPCKRSRDSETLEVSAGSRTEPPSQLTDEQWFLIANLFPKYQPSPLGGRPPAPVRACVEGVLWILRTGARWKDLPPGFPSPTTCWRRFHEWTAAGIWARAWTRLLRVLDRREQIDHEQAIADGTFSSAKKGVNASARRSVARAQKSCSWSTPQVFPLPQTFTAPARTRSRSSSLCSKAVSCDDGLNA
jgi:transposase